MLTHEEAVLEYVKAVVRTEVSAVGPGMGVHVCPLCRYTATDHGAIGQFVRIDVYIYPHHKPSILVCLDREACELRRIGLDGIS